MPIVLRPLEVSHLPHVMTWVNDREVMQYFATRQAHIDETAERAYLASLVASKTDRAWSLFDEAPGVAPGGGEYVGQVSLNQIYWPAKNGRLFVVIRKAMQGKGHGRAAIEGVLERARSELGLHKVWLIVRRDNKLAQAMYVKLGFEFEGVLRDEYCVNGTYFDMVRMAQLI